MAKKGQLIAVPRRRWPRTSTNDFVAGWDELATVDGKVYGIPGRANVKSLVWYSPKAFADKGYEIPTTLDELKALSDKIVADGGTPWCAGIESGVATGWPITDWFEDFMLRINGARRVRPVGQPRDPVQRPEGQGRCRRRRRHRQEPRLPRRRERRQGDRHDQVPRRRPPDPRPATATCTARPASTPPSGPKGTKVGPDGDVDTFYLPGQGRRPEVHARRRRPLSLPAPTSPRRWTSWPTPARPTTPAAIAQAGDNELSPRKDFDTALITDPVMKAFAELLKNSDVFRFDGADMMPGAVGSGTFWTEATAWIVGGSTDDMLNNIEASLEGPADKLTLTRVTQRVRSFGCLQALRSTCGQPCSWRTVGRWSPRRMGGCSWVTCSTTLITVAIGSAVIVAVLACCTALTRVPAGAMGASEGRSWSSCSRRCSLMFVGLLVPAVRTIYVSFLDDNGKKFESGSTTTTRSSPRTDTRLTVVNSLTWVVVGTVVTVIVALAIARFADGMRGEKAAKSLIFIPAAISLAGAGIIWRFVYAGPPFKVGLLNPVTKAIPGLPASMGGNGDQIWLLERGFGGINPPATAPGFNTFLLIVIFIWASAGFATVIFSAAIKGVPDSLIEAAKVDGATNRQVFYKVTLPYIRATIVTVATITTIAGLKAFDIVAATTGGNFGTEHDRQRVLQHHTSCRAATASARRWPC